MTADKRYYYAFPSETPGSGEPSLSEVGGKALSLIEASAAKFPVPPGLVLTVAFFEAWLEDIGKSPEWVNFIEAGVGATKELCDGVKALCINSLVLTSDQETYLQEALQKAFNRDGKELQGTYGFGVVAVRSSSPEEDLAGSSFAGGYDTTLGVTPSNLSQALVASFASMFDHRVVQYKLQHNLDIGKPRIAVVVQRQIASDVSGVGFSINPSNNCYDEVMISANFGLGESVVGGIVTPDVYVVDRIQSKIASKKVANKAEAIWLGETRDGSSGTRQEKNGDPTAQALSDEQILEVSSLVCRVEEAQGGHPVDIEWAFLNNELYLLQARPVTAYIPLFPELVTERGGEKRLYMDVIVMSQGFSEPLSVLGLDVWKSMVMAAKPQFSTEGKDGLMWNIHGRQYINVSNFMKSIGGRKQVDTVFRAYDPSIDRALGTVDLDDYEPSITPDGAKGVGWKYLKQLGPMMPSIFSGLYKGEAAMDDYVQRSEEVIKICHDDTYMQDASFGSVVESIMKKFDELLPLVGAVMSGMISRWRLDRMFHGCEGAKDLLISLCMDLDGNPTSEMGHAMVRLASFPEIQKTESGDDFVRKLNEEGSFSSEFLSAYGDFMHRFGCRGMKEIDIATPRTYEKETDFFNQLKQINTEKNAINNVTERRKAAYQELLAKAKELGKEDTFKHHANIIQRLFGYREHPKYLFVVMVDMMRRRALKIGYDFSKRGRLERAEQIFDLKVAQITEAQSNKDTDVLQLVKANKEPYKKVEHVKNWPVIIDSRGRIIRGKPKEQDIEGGILVGDPVSPGTVKGRAKVLFEPYEKPLEQGEILVTRFTEPSWTPIFINAAGVVMEVGGPLQHGAIIAREYGIPCISGLDNATTLIKDGDLIEIDGSAGTIQLVQDEGTKN